MLSLRSWLVPGLTKSALLIHGNRELGDTWYQVAESLVKQGYAVTAPDMMNNGFSSRQKPPNVQIEDYAQFLYSNLPSNCYSVICGVSLGANVALDYWKLLPPQDRAERLVLLEPAFDLKMPKALVERISKSQDDPLTEERLLANHPGWSKVTAAVDRLGLLATDKEVFQWMFSGDGPDFPKHSVLPTAEDTTPTEIIILAADQTSGALYKVEECGPILEKERPHVRLGHVPGTAHLIHKDDPEAVADALVGIFDDTSRIQVVR